MFPNLNNGTSLSTAALAHNMLPREVVCVYVSIYMGVYIWSLVICKKATHL